MVLKYQHFDLLEKVILERMVFRAPFRTSIEMYNEACFLHVVNGTTNGYGARDKVKGETGDSVVMKCGTYLAKWAPPKENEDPCEAVAVHFTPEVLQLVFQDDIPQILLEDKPAKVTMQKVAVDAMIENYVQSLLFYFENPSLVNEELIILKVKELVLLLINSQNGEQLLDILQSLFHPEELSFKQVIENHIFHDLSQEDLAMLTHMSLSSFKRKFKEIFEASPASYIRQKRIERAKQLLKLKEKSITEIAFDCGYNDSGYFAKVFKSQTGQSPTEFRKKVV